MGDTNNGGGGHSLPRRTLDAIVDAMADPLFVKDHEHRFILVNRSACEMFGHPREGPVSPAVSAELTELSPGFRTLLMSGYTSDSIEAGDRVVLRKPFRRRELAAAIRAVLAG